MIARLLQLDKPELCSSSLFKEQRPPSGWLFYRRHQTARESVGSFRSASQTLSVHANAGSLQVSRDTTGTINKR
jgi:hypothetical protein